MCNLQSEKVLFLILRRFPPLYLFYFTSTLRFTVSYLKFLEAEELLPKVMKWLFSTLVEFPTLPTLTEIELGTEAYGAVENDKI